jgi:septum formation protein
MDPTNPEIVLASASPRRRELLGHLLGNDADDFRVVAPEIDETPARGESPSAYVERLARAKALAVAEELEVAAQQADREPTGTLVIAADTTVDVDGEILGKPVDVADARRMLRRLSGRAHYVHTGVAVLRAGRLESAVDETRVHLAPLTDADLEWYLGTGEPFDKAGAYALQGAGGVFVTRVAGSVSNVVGLPLTLVVELAGRLGVRLPRSSRRR